MHIGRWIHALTVHIDTVRVTLDPCQLPASFYLIIKDVHTENNACENKRFDCAQDMGYDYNVGELGRPVRFIPAVQVDVGRVSITAWHVVPSLVHVLVADNLHYLRSQCTHPHSEARGGKFSKRESLETAHLFLQHIFSLEECTVHSLPAAASVSYVSSSSMDRHPHRPGHRPHAMPSSKKHRARPAGRAGELLVLRLHLAEVVALSQHRVSSAHRSKVVRLTVRLADFFVFSEPYRAHTETKKAATEAQTKALNESVEETSGYVTNFEKNVQKSQLLAKIVPEGECVLALVVYREYVCLFDGLYLYTNQSMAVCI